MNNSLYESLTRPNITVYVKTKSCLSLRISKSFQSKPHLILNTRRNLKQRRRNSRVVVVDSKDGSLKSINHFHISYISWTCSSRELTNQCLQSESTRSYCPIIHSSLPHSPVRKNPQFLAVLVSSAAAGKGSTSTPS